jgi:NOL1/NOP2/fmu family ribosome biogenesis protein
MKQSGFLKRQQAQKAADISFHRKFTMQWCSDAAILAANEVFQRRGEKIVEFHNAFVRWSHEIAEMTLEDAKGDKSLEYTKAKVDEELKKILGKAFVPWDERYRF